MLCSRRQPFGHFLPVSCQEGLRTRAFAVKKAFLRTVGVSVPSLDRDTTLTVHKRYEQNI